MTSSQIKIWYAWHKWSSLVCTVFMLMLCITGLPLIFAHEIDHALGYSVDPPVLEQNAPHNVSVANLVAAAKARRPQDAVQFVTADPDEPDIMYLRMGENIEGEISAFLTYDLRTGEFLNDYPLDQGFMNVMLRLHIDMFAGLPGTLFLGFMGILLVVSLVSGTVVYAPYMRKLKFATVRRHRSARIKWLDLHNLLGITTLVWLLVVGATGAINTLSIPIFAQWQKTELAAMTAAYKGEPPIKNTISADQAIAAANAAEPDMALSFMAFPGNEFASPHHYAAFMSGQTSFTSKLLKPVLIDAGTGQITAQRDLPWTVGLLLLSQPLHFGDYGGLPLKILWALLDVLAIIVLASGVYLWFKKRKIPVEKRLRRLRAETESSPIVATAARYNET